MDEKFLGPPTLHIDDDCWQEIKYLASKSDFEISGYGRVVVEDGEIHVIGVHLVQQENTKTTSDLDPLALCKLQYECRNLPGTLRWWWHYHGPMGVFWSGTDKATLAEIASPQWAVATVFNDKGEHKSAFVTSQPVPHMVDDIPVVFDRYYSKAQREAWDKEYERCVVNKRSSGELSPFARQQLRMRYDSASKIIVPAKGDSDMPDLTEEAELLLTDKELKDAKSFFDEAREVQEQLAWQAYSSRGNY